MFKDIEKYKVSKGTSIRQVMESIDSNNEGFVVVTDKNGYVAGLVTDGDIRRALLLDTSLDDRIDALINKDFVFVDVGAPQEKVLKLLDNRIRVIPVLDKNKKLHFIYSKDNLPLKSQSEVFYRAKAPVRVTFGGGGSDLTSYFSKYGGAVINASISIYTHSTLYIRKDKEINIYSKDIGDSFHSSDLAEAHKHKGKFKLILAVIKIIDPEHGFDLFIDSDYPMSSGLGGSAVVAASILGCFNQTRIDKWDSYDIAELAFQAERFMMDLPGGWQDQYATVVGGFNFMEFNMDRNTISSLRIPSETTLELEESLILCHTGVGHDSGEIHTDQREKLSETEVQKLLMESVKLTWETKDAILRGDLKILGRNLHKSWMLKRNFGKKITNNFLDDIYDFAISNGATGGKLLGAGGGGYFLFYVEPKKKFNFLSSLESKGLEIMPFTFDQHGLQTWSVRKERSEEEHEF